ncbi:MAG: ferredoxin [Acidimicrobiales bacterium]|nr:ferredoxin [Acidimicrobiales bacterium]
MTALRIEIDHGLCGGASECVRAQPELFELNQEGRASLRRVPGDHERDACLAAAWACPTSAIRVFEGDEELDPYPG